MILKGNSRRGAVDLALHLSNEVDNETVTIAETRGTVADNLYDGFREWEFICAQSNAKDPFYSLSINPDPSQRDWRDKEWQKAINHIEDCLDLNRQPRTIIYHAKQGEDGNVRKHAHVVWSRIKTDNGQLKAVHLGYDYYRLKTCARELAKEFGLELRYGVAKSQNYDHAKSHGKNCDPQTVETRKQFLTKLWNEADSAEAFKRNIEQSGYVIAQGERRAFVIVDRDVKIHALVRSLEGVRTKEVKARLGDPINYPSVEQAKDEQRLRIEAGEKANQARTDLTREQRQMQKLRRMAQRADRLSASRHKKLKQLTSDMAKRHQQELHDLKCKQRAYTINALRKRADRQPKGFVKTLCSTIGVTNIINWLDSAEDKKRERQHVEQKNILKSNHEAEQTRLGRKETQIYQQEKREAQSIRKLARKLTIQQDIATLAKERPDKRETKFASLRLA